MTPALEIPQAGANARMFLLKNERRSNSPSGFQQMRLNGNERRGRAGAGCASESGSPNWGNHEM